VRPNEPKYVVHVADALADLWGAQRIDVREQMHSNAVRFFGLHTAPEG
jgi:Tat protein secretion system quality control protein TatD with DNase activity